MNAKYLKIKTYFFLFIVGLFIVLLMVLSLHKLNGAATYTPPNSDSIIETDTTAADEIKAIELRPYDQF